jgi:hypothetical protein
VHDLGLSHGTIGRIIQELGLHKVCERWALGALSEDHKAQRMVTAVPFLQQYAIHDHDFLERIVTGDETWVPGDKTCKPGVETSRVPATGKMQDGKVMAAVFWDRRGVLLVDFMGKTTAINAASCRATLERLRAATKKKRPGLLTIGVMFLNDNARTHVATATRHCRRFRWTTLGTSTIQRRCGAEWFSTLSRP